MSSPLTPNLTLTLTSQASEATQSMVGAISSLHEAIQRSEESQGREAAQLESYAKDGLAACTKQIEGVAFQQSAHGSVQDLL